MGTEAFTILSDSKKTMYAFKEVIERSERLELSERDSLQVMDLLEHPPEPNEKLMAAAFAMSRDL